MALLLLQEMGVTLACIAPALRDQRQRISPSMQCFWTFGFGHF